MRAGKKKGEKFNTRNIRKTSWLSSEGKQYDSIFKVGGAGIAMFIFDSPNSFHYLAVKDNANYLVEETIK